MLASCKAFVAMTFRLYMPRIIYPGKVLKIFFFFFFVSKENAIGYRIGFADTRSQNVRTKNVHTAVVSNKSFCVCFIYVLEKGRVFMPYLAS